MRYKCIVAYDGYDYYGYQAQKHESRTIQNTIEEALKKMFKKDIIIYASGRTDRKVHALGQVFHFDYDNNITQEAILKGLNSFLPSDIKILKVNKVRDDFHARYDVKKKQYLYIIENSKIINPFYSRYVTYIKEEINIERLKQAATYFIGHHDFKNFTTNNEKEIANFEKDIYKIKITKNKQTIKILFEGSGFLRYMVRMIVGALIVVATEKKDFNYIKKLIDLQSIEKCSYKAEPQGLYLKKVFY